MVIDKQCRPRSDAAVRGVWSGSTLFTLKIGIYIKHSNYKNKLTRHSAIGSGQVQRVVVEESTDVNRLRYTRIVSRCGQFRHFPIHFVLRNLWLIPSGPRFPFEFRIVRVAAWLAPLTSDHEVLGSNPAGGRIQLMTVRCFIVQSISLSLFHRLHMT